MRYFAIIWIVYLLLIIAMPCQHHDAGHEADVPEHTTLHQQDTYVTDAVEDHSGTCSPFCGFQCCQASVKPEAGLDSFLLALPIVSNSTFFPDALPEQFPSGIFQPPRRA